MKHVVVFIGMLLCLNSIAFGANNQNILFHVNGLYDYSENVKSALRQQATGASNSCGPTSLLFVNSYFSVKNTGIKPIFAENVPNAKSELSSLYSYIGQSYNTITSLNQLRDIAKYKWGWSRVHRMSTSSGINTNVEYLIDYLNNDIPALVVLSSYYSGNPTYGTHGIDHIVIVYAYQKRPDNNGNGATSPYNNRQNDRIYFYDPYYGGNGYFTRGEISTAVNLAGFAFLTIAPWY